MKIGEAAKYTGLTKKAVRYYEEQGLIEPSVNIENGYREYSQDDIKKLIQVSVYRNIDMPMALIKQILSSADKKDKEEMLRKHLADINEKIDELNIEREIVYKLINNNVDLDEINRNIIKNRKRDSYYATKKLIELFPGFYGKYLLIHFEEYLNEPLDTKEKQEAFNRIVEYLDNTDIIEIDYPDEWKKYIEDMDDDKYIESHKNVDRKIKNLVNLDSEGIESLKKEAEEYIKKQNSEEYKDFFKIYNKMKSEWAEKLKKNGYYDIFIYNMKIISPKYKKYVEKLEDLNQKLHLKYDIDGNVIISNEIK